METGTTSTRPCPNCGHEQLAAVSAVSLCPRCGHDLNVSEAGDQGSPRRLAAKALLGAAIGMAPGALYLVFGQPLWFCVMLMVQGAFVGSVIVLAKLKARNLVTLGAGMMAASMVPKGLQSHVLDAIVGEDEGSEKSNDESGDTGAT